MKKMLAGLGFSVVLASGLFANSLMMATTTSTEDTGLLDSLAPKFKQDTGIELKWVSTGTGKALKMGENCDVDVLLVHAPEAEKKFVEAGFGKDRKEVMYNDFVIVGSKKDPAKVEGKTTQEAFKTIKEKQANFISRGDKSGTHEKDKWYIQSGQGMIITLNMAAEKEGYTLTDRGTWIKYESQKGDSNTMKMVVENDNSLFNQYSVIPVNKDKCPKAQDELAKKFSDWLVSADTQKFIGDFKLLNKPLFIPNAK